MEKNKFTIKPESSYSDSDYQLSFDDLTSMTQNQDVISKIPYVDYLLIDGKEFSFPSKRFFMVSLLVHSLLFATIIFYSFNPDLLPKKAEEKNMITFTIEDSAPSSMGKSGATPVAETPPEVTAVETLPVAPAPAPAEETAPPAKSEDTIVVAKTPAKTVSKKIAAAKTVKPASQKLTSKPAAAIIAATAPQAKAIETYEAPADIDDIAIPALSAINENEATEKLAPPNFDEIKNKFDEIDNEDSSKIVAANQELEELNSNSLNAIEDKTAQVEAQNSELDAIAEKRKGQLAEEKRQYALAAQKSAADEAAKQKASKASGLAASGNGNSAGNSSSEQGAGVGAGDVRKLEDLRQMPGNTKPQYDIEDRVKGLSGNIVLYGFVTKEGSLSSFKMVQSTGHRNLDRKTLMALKKWKFYPGQEGWVELPFKWDLKGGVQQKPTLLKRR